MGNPDDIIGQMCILIWLDLQCGEKRPQWDAKFSGEALSLEFFVFFLDYLEEFLSGLSLKKPLAKV